MEERSGEKPGPLKPSRYNLVSALEDGTRLAFNAGTAALVEIDQQTYPAVARILADPGSVSSPEDEQVLRNLVEGGYLVPAGVDEPSALRAKSRDRRTNNSCLFLTIAPTLGCNFDCEYCFQRHDAVRMSRATEEALISFSAERIAGSDGVLVTWFGGEPTLCLPTIERIQGALGDLAARHGVSMDPASIVTNGYLLDGAMASRLAARGILAAQVTLDGPERQHDQRRKLRGGRGTFGTILRNLAESAEILHVVIRVNVDRDNVDAAPEVLEVLDREGILPKVQVQFAPVNETEGTCADMTGRCFTNEEFARRQLRLYDGLVKRGFTKIDYPDLGGSGACGAAAENSYVVGPNGLLFKCFEELSLESAKSIGTVFSKEREPHQEANLDLYRSWDPFAKTACVACDILPLCLGGCPLRGLRREDSDRGACAPWKHNLVEMLRLRYVCEGREVRA